MKVVSAIAEVRAARRAWDTFGLVPTMGFLHEGHLSLVRRAKADCGACGVSLFVNPTQFAPGEDFERYPRNQARDLALLEAAGADLVFTPLPAEIYPAGFDARIEIGGVTARLEGAVRPGHFAGVATVVSKLLNIVQPTRAYFGQKDAQQCVVVRKLVRDFNLPVEIVVAPTVREADGLAMSSRNAYLDPEQRARAPGIYAALRQAQALFADGARDAEILRQAVREALEAITGAGVDYVSLADPDDLHELDQAQAGAVLSVAVRLGATRLLDNVILEG